MQSKEHFYLQWEEFYKSIKDPSWPECVTTHEFKFLPECIQHEIIHNHDGLKYIQLTDDDIEVYSEESYIQIQKPKPFSVAKDFAVYFTEEIDGYGRYHSQIYPLMIAKLYPDRQFQSCLEWCAGAGFIGFRLIADEIVNSIVMMDKFAPAIEACNFTWKHRPNRLKHKIMETVQGSTVDCLGDRKFDLIVANPPNFDSKIKYLPDNNHARITQDPGWKSHTDFFLGIKKNLMPDAKILFMKHNAGSQPSDHIKAINDGGLKINQILRIKNHTDFYFLEIVCQQDFPHNQKDGVA